MAIAMIVKVVNKAGHVARKSGTESLMDASITNPTGMLTLRLNIQYWSGVNMIMLTIAMKEIMNQNKRLVG